MYPFAADARFSTALMRVCGRRKKLERLLNSLDHPHRR
jgi:hypothetical protein